MQKSNGESSLERKQNVSERRQKDDMVWWEDDEKYGVCSWCPKKAEVEQYLRHLELFLQIRSVTNGVDRPYKYVAHIICEEHLKEVIDGYFHSRMKGTGKEHDK